MGAHEYRFRVTPTIGSKFEALAKANGVSMTAMFSFLVNQYSASSGQPADNQRTISGSANTPPVADNQRTTSGQLAESEGGIIGGKKTHPENQPTNQPTKGVVEKTIVLGGGVGEPRHPKFDPDGFARLWGRMVKKTTRLECVDWWDKNRPSSELQAKMHAACDWQMPEYAKRDREHQLDPIRWLKRARWDDEPPKSVTASASARPVLDSLLAFAMAKHASLVAGKPFRVGDYDRGAEWARYVEAHPDEWREIAEMVDAEWRASATSA